MILLTAKMPHKIQQRTNDWLVSTLEISKIHDQELCSYRSLIKNEHIDREAISIYLLKTGYLDSRRANSDGKLMDRIFFCESLL